MREAPTAKPEPPAVAACCQGNCIPCIFDVYERELERWERAAMARSDNEPAGGPSPLELLRARMG
jgi:hypothetical protein